MTTQKHEWHTIHHQRNDSCPMDIEQCRSCSTVKRTIYQRPGPHNVEFARFGMWEKVEPECSKILSTGSGLSMGG
jgi:hypothetical protein